MFMKIGYYLCNISKNVSKLKGKSDMGIKGGQNGPKGKFKDKYVELHNSTLPQ